MSATLLTRRRLLGLAGALAVASVLAGCGRRSALDPPPGWRTPPDGAPAAEGSEKPKPPKGPIKSSEPIFLDKLLN